MSGQRLNHWRRANITINSAALSHNLKRVRAFAPNSKVMAVIKADAYGHGMLTVARHLAEAELFAVAMPEEAYALRASGCTRPIIVLHGFSDQNELQKFSALNISTVIHQQAQLACLQQNTLSSPVDAWLKVNTGMNRLGIPMADVAAYFSELRNNKNIARVFLMSHFASADEVENQFNNSQLSNFLKVSSNIDVDCSMANSAATIALPQSHFEVVRPGIMLYGSSPFTDRSAADLGLQPVMQFESVLIEIRQIEAGEVIGYGGTFTSNQAMTMGVVAVGYGDGYPRQAKNGTPVWINGKRCKLLGRVSMDSLCIELTDVTAKRGDRVVLWGSELSVDDVALASGSIAYELLCNAGAACSVRV